MARSYSPPPVCPVHDMKHYVLVDLTSNEILGKLRTSPEVINCMNKFKWMLATHWQYQIENQCEMEFARD